MIGDKHVPISIGGVEVCNGEWLYADEDGIIVSKTELPPVNKTDLPVFSIDD